MSKPKEKTIIGFFDAVCPKCQKRYGWHGKLANRPLCPKCGHAVTLQELEDTESEIKQLDVFCIVQTLFYEHKEQMGTTEAAFIENMYTRSLHSNRNRRYNNIQETSIKRIAKKYGVLE